MLTHYDGRHILSTEGPYEELVQKFWTRDSIISARLDLFLSYLGWLVPLNLTAGVYSKEDSAPEDPAPKKLKSGKTKSSNPGPAKSRLRVAHP
jgi:hypothetical protein